MIVCPSIRSSNPSGMIGLIRELKPLGISNLILARLLCFTVLFAFFEGIGIGMLLPVLEYIEKDRSGQTSGLWHQISSVFHSMGIPPGPYEILGFLSAAFLALILRSGLNYVRDIDASRLKFTISRAFRERAADAFLHSDFSYFSSLRIGELHAALTMESDRAAEALASRISFTTALVLSSVYLLLMFLIAPILAALTIPVCLLVGLIFNLQGKTMHTLSTKVSDRNRTFGVQINDRLQGMLRIKMEGQEKEIGQEFFRNISGISDSLFGIDRRRILVEIGIFPILVLASFALLFVAVDHLGMTLASLGIFLFLLVRMAPHLTLMNSIWSHMHACLASLRALEGAIQDAMRHRDSSGGRIEFNGIRSDIRLVDVGFRYPREDQRQFALQNISAVIPKGSLIALVGRSGSGKSTLIKILAGLFPQQRGEILFDSRTIAEFTTSSLRRKIALVPQEPYFFSGSIRSNITFGLNPVPEEAEVDELLRQTSCGEFLKTFDRGLDTIVGERGNRLSQGQRQRLAIVHALAKKPAILILDEPTSALDSESEQAIRQTLQQWRGILTIFVIANRLSTI